MKKMKILENFASELEKGSAKIMSYEQMCRAIGVRPARVDRIVSDALGVSGRVVAECYRRDLPASLVIPECA